MSQAHVLETLFSKFHQNRLSYLGCRADKDTLTHRHTHKQPRSILTYSVKMTEYKKLASSHNSCFKDVKIYTFEMKKQIEFSIDALNSTFNGIHYRYVS